MSKPGVMLYFDVRPCLKRLSPEDRGQLFEAILDYAEYGVVPELEGALGVAWDFIKPRIDADDEHYKQTVEARKKAANSRWSKEKELEDMQMHTGVCK